MGFYCVCVQIYINMQCLLVQLSIYPSMHGWTVEPLGARNLLWNWWCQHPKLGDDMMLKISDTVDDSKHPISCHSLAACCLPGPIHLWSHLLPNQSLLSESPGFSIIYLMLFLSHFSHVPSISLHVVQVLFFPTCTLAISILSWVTADPWRHDATPFILFL